jgi:hypothetical protein
VAFYKRTIINQQKWPVTGDEVEKRTSGGIY